MITSLYKIAPTTNPPIRYENSEITGMHRHWQRSVPEHKDSKFGTVVPTLSWNERQEGRDKHKKSKHFAPDLKNVKRNNHNYVIHSELMLLLLHNALPFSLISMKQLHFPKAAIRKSVSLHSISKMCCVCACTHACVCVCVFILKIYRGNTHTHTQTHIENNIAPFSFSFSFH